MFEVYSDKNAALISELKFVQDANCIAQYKMDSQELLTADSCVPELPSVSAL